MSACPDAALCESVFDDVFDLVGNLVDVNLIYIAKLNSTSKYGVSCMHGELECDGNVQQLCAAKYWRGSEDEVKPWIDNWNVSSFPSESTLRFVFILADNITDSMHYSSVRSMYELWS